MLRNLAVVVSFVSLAFVAAIITSCGSSGTHLGTMCTGGPFNVVGDWTFSSGSASGPGAIDPSGLAVFFQTSTAVPAPGDTVVLPTITGACSFSGTGVAFGTPGSGGGSASNPVTGSVNSATSISGSISNGNTFTIVPNSPLSGSVTALSGNGWLAEVEGATNPIIWNLSFTPSGTGNSMTFAGSGQIVGGSLCNISGTFNQQGTTAANLNVFDISITSSDAGCPIGGTATGIGFESSSDYFAMHGNAAGTYFYAALSNSASVFEIFKPGGNRQ